MTTWARAGACTGSNYTFLTQKERDNETGLDYFGARYFASTQGRFTSADPLMASGRAPRPQSWNRYSYVLNNPLRLVDPNGLEDKEIENGTGEEECPDCDENAEPQRDTVTVKAATISVGTHIIRTDAGAFGVTFNLTPAQTAEVFGGQPYQVNVSLQLPEDVASMTPTTNQTEQGVGKKQSVDRILSGEAAKDKETLVSGSRLELPENSNFRVGTGRPYLTPGENRRPPDVTFTDITSAPNSLKTTTASVTLNAGNDKMNGSNSFSLRVEGVSKNGQTLRFRPIQITIRPSKE